MMNDSLARAGTVMLSDLYLIIGMQMLLALLRYDMANVFDRPLKNRILGVSDTDGQLRAGVMLCVQVRLKFHRYEPCTASSISV